MRLNWLGFSALLMFLGVWPVGAETVRLTNGEWAPYLSEALPKYGAASHIVQQAYQAVGVEVEYGFFPWKRSYRLAKDGKWHGTVIWVYTNERARVFHYADVVLEDREYLFHLKTSPLNWRSVADLKGSVIGATLHTVYPLFEAAEADGLLTIERAGNYDSLFRRLLKRRIDAIPNVRQVGLYLLRTTLSPEDRNRITYSPTVIEKRQYHLLLSKAHPDGARLTTLFNAGLRILKESGRYAAILKQLEIGGFDARRGRSKTPDAQ